jgi:hypothetical protein
MVVRVGCNREKDGGGAEAFVALFAVAEFDGLAGL